MAGIRLTSVRDYQSKKKFYKMGIDGDSMVLLVCATAVTSTLFLNNIVGTPESERFYCHGDYCRTDEPNEFCSETYRICRPCTDIIDDCLSSDLPRNCSKTCIRHKVEQQMKELQGNACPVLTEITNGKHNGSVTDTHKPGEVIEYNCDMGYRLYGDGHRECRQYGYWSDDSPTCEKLVCQLLPSVTNGMHNGTSVTLTPGAVVVTSCAVGYKMYGGNTTVCSSDGDWSNPLPVCKKINCVQPHPLRNGKWLLSHKASRRYMSGHILRAQCEEGYVMDGPAEWNCTHEGNWKSSDSPYLPVCFLQGKSAETCSCKEWQLWMGVALVFSVCFNIGCLYMLYGQRRLCFWKECMVIKLNRNDKDIEACVIGDESKRLLDEEVISLRNHNKPREKVILSGESNIPIPNTYNSKSKEQPVSFSTTDTPQGAPVPVTVTVITNNNIQGGTSINKTTVESKDQQTTPNTQSTEDDTSNVTKTTQSEASQVDKTSVEESGVSCIPSQPESAGDTLQNQSELSDGTLPSELGSSGDTVPRQFEISGGTLPRQTGSADGTPQRQSESVGSTLLNQSESSRGILPSHQDLGATLPSQNESYHDTNAMIQQMPTVTDALNNNEERNSTTHV